jgi:demethylmenaquinone methyltransferase/2-methoxy-6-polyprenyl-1,4-benzoquinol methylase
MNPATSPLPPPADKATVVREMFDRIAPRYDLVNRVMTGRLDARWRRRAVRALGLPRGSHVLDLACGTGDFCVELTRAGHRPIGVDSSEGMLSRARLRTDATLITADILDLPMDAASADGITCGFALRNVVDIPRCFVEMARVLRPGGRLAVLEIARPDNGIVRRMHRWYFGRVVPVIGGVIGGDRAAYEYLPASAMYLPPPRELLAMVGAAGFENVRRTPLGLGAAQLLTADRASRVASAV